jgi:hypothetical protein
MRKTTVVIVADFVAESMKSQQFDLAGCHVGPGNDFNAGRQTALVWSRGDYPAPAKSEILHTLPQEKTGGGSEGDVNTIWRHIDP